MRIFDHFYLAISLINIFLITQILLLPYDSIEHM